MKEITVIVPSFNPDEKLYHTIVGLREAGFEDILLVNDGSKAECLHYFEACDAFDEVTLLCHEVNRGKGAALKTAIAYAMEHRPEIIGAVTADGDGQHRPEDILACAEAMRKQKDHLILGVRDFTSPEVPPRSKFGNSMTSFVFRTGVGLKIKDTQTGLRALPRQWFDVLLQTKGDRYEYETNMLLDMKRVGIPFEQVTIQTVYIDENATSHFHPIRDSLRIYSQILKFCAGSLAATLVDYLAFYLISLLTAGMLGKLWILVATVAARVLSSLVNFTWNRKIAFHSGRSIGSSLLRYYCLAIPQMLASAGLLQLLTMLIGKSYLPLVTVLKIAVDTTLFFLSYRIQKYWVFKK